MPEKRNKIVRSILTATSCTLLLSSFCVSCGQGKGGEAGKPTSTADTGEYAQNTETALPSPELSTEFVPSKYDIATNATDNKIILDCDMTYLGDDAMCMCILAQADALCWIDLLGITVTGGNTVAADAANAVLNQLEKIGRSDIPVYIGTDIPLMGFRDMQEQEKVVGKIEPWGAMFKQDSYVSPENYHDLGVFYNRAWGYSRSEAQEQDSVDFMIEQVKKYPGQVTVIAAGPVTNIALACRKDAAFAENTAGIIFVAGAFEGKGGATKYADFNGFYDAEALEICLESAFPVKIILLRDLAPQGALNKAVFDMMEAKPDTLISRMWLDGQYSLYRRNPAYQVNCTDAIAAAVLLNHGVVLKREKRCVAVDADTKSASYGAVRVMPAETGGGGEAEDFKEVDVISGLDAAVYWDFVTDVLCGTQSEKDGVSYKEFLEK